MDYPDFKKEFLLSHKILTILRNIGMTINSTGSDEKGMVPLHEFKIGYSFLNFGTLVGLLNNPEDFRVPEGQVNYLQNRKTVKTEIKIKDYDYEIVSRAVDRLVYEEEVIKEVDNEWLQIESKKIKLTEKGLHSLYNNKYLKEHHIIERSEELHNSTVNTNFWIKCFTGVLVATAIISVFIQLYQLYKEQNKPESKVELHIGKIDSTLKSFQSSQKDMNLLLKGLLDSIYKQKR